MSIELQTIFGFKVDIDTYEGGKEDIPNLIRLFKKHDIPASFFGVMGPDHSGRAAFRVFTHKGFLRKMIRTKAPSQYGLKTMLYGTLLPGPFMPVKLKKHYKNIIDEGFELGMHGYDHIAWHNNLTRWSEERIRNEYKKMMQAYSDAIGEDVKSLGTPGWQESIRHIKVTDSLGFSYRSDTRFSQPYFPSIDGYVSNTLEIPTTFPSLDEIMGREDMQEKNPVEYMMQYFEKDKVNIFTLHTELEGRSYLGFLEEFILKLKEIENIEFLTLSDISKRICQKKDIPKKTFHMGEVKGRAGLVAIAENK
ncbi:MAG: polysaccharide deacetylase family protein [Candidatus Pacebacteria bacterium]|nr:polysaccharide deacetylase family protein [Candidatus Paceibacterota bacterium]